MHFDARLFPTGTAGVTSEVVAGGPAIQGAVNDGGGEEGVGETFLFSLVVCFV